MKRRKNLLCASLTLFILTSLVLSIFFNPQFTLIHSVHGGSTKVLVNPSSIVPPDAPVPEEGGKITLRPNGDGTYAEWTGSYTAWDEYPDHDGDATYVSIAEKDKSQSSTLEDSGTETWEIASVKVTIFAKTNVSANDDLVVPTLVIDGNEYRGKEKLLGLTPDDYTIWTNEWGKNPATDAFWTWGEIDQLEAGVRSKLRLGSSIGWKGEIRVTQLYVEVSGPRFTVDINVEDVLDLHLYVFEMFYNPDIIQGVWVNPDAPVEIGPFLGSAGGTINKNPGSGFDDTVGWLSITGAYLAEIDVAKNPDGSGVLSTVIFKVVRKGETELRLGEETGLMDPGGNWIMHGENLEHGSFRNVDSALIPTADFTYAAVSPAPVPLEGYNVTFTDTSTPAADRTIDVRKWYFWKRQEYHRYLDGAIVESQSTLTRNYTRRGEYNVTLTVFDNDGVVGTKTGYVIIKAHDVWFSAITTNARIASEPAGVPYVDIGENLEITVVAVNEGGFTETFNVSCFWSGQYAGEVNYGEIDQSIQNPTTVTSLAAGASKNLTFYWDTTGRNITHPTLFRIHANASRVPFEYDVEWSPDRIADNERQSDSHRVRFHDIALSELTPSEPDVTQGVPVTVEITVTNQGDFNETNFVVKLWAQNLTWSTEIGNQTIHLMTNKTFSDRHFKLIPPYLDNYTTTLTFDWDTTGVSSGTYNISAEASVVPVEYQITDNVINRPPPQWVEYPVDWNGGAGTDFYVSVLQDLMNGTVSSFGGLEEKMEVNFDFDGPSGETRYCYLAVPKKDALKGYPCLVLLGGDDKTFEAFISQNSTHMFFYFTWEFSSPVYVQILGPNLYPVDYPAGGPIDYYVDIASNSTISNFDFSTLQEFGNVTFDVTGGNYCAVGVPTELLGPDYTVYIDDVSVSFTLTSNATHSFLYLPPYSADGHTITIKGTAPDNEPPVADAGADQTVDEDTIVTFDGTGSTDNVGIVDYTWTFTDVTPQTLTGETPTYNFANPGIYVVTLTVADARNNQGTDDVTITVLDVTLPTADAGVDKTVDEDTIVTFDGTGSTDNVGIVDYTWTFTDVTPQTLTGETPTYNFTTPSLTPYTVTLNVSDAAGNWDTDEVVITVLDTTPPVANAGPDQTVDEDTEVTFDGSDSTDNEPVTGIESYVWNFTDVTTPETKEGMIVTYTFETPGTYTVTLNVTDAAGYWDVDDVEISVNDVTKPIADAGLDQTVNVGEAVDFDAGGSSDNVGIVSYEWDFGDGTTGTGVTTSHTYQESGEYTVTLTVKDAAGNTETDVATITVSAAEGFPIWAIGVIVAVVAIGAVAAFIFLRRRRS